MPYAPKSFRTAHQASRKQKEQAWESRRSGNHALYNRWEWRKPEAGLRAMVLKRDPLCVECLKKDRLIKSTQADHIVPHKGDEELFFDIDNCQGLCASCHSEKTKRENP